MAKLRLPPRRVVLLALAAVGLRLLLLLGRGNYLAFDEGWYLLLARSLYTGDGYSLVGFPHTALSPLFPILAGAAGAVMGSWVWGGRIVAAIASGLVVLPAWSIFRRLAAERTAFIAAALVAVLPSLAPFVVPFWIGADLWVGAEPLLHLFLYTGVALWLRADELSRGDSGDVAPPTRRFSLAAWLLAGLAFGLAFLARPEAIITWGLLGLLSLGLAVVTRSPRHLAGAALMGVGLVALATPYWLYVHDVSGQWSLTGRGIELPTVTVTSATGRSRASRTIEQMLWEDDQGYRERLYGLDATGLHLRSDYWGVEPRDSSTLASGAASSGPVAAPPEVPQSAVPPGARTGSSDTQGPRPVTLYFRAMAMILPLLLWLFVLLGVIAPRPEGVVRRELPVSISLLGTSLAIALVVAVDPRTQLLLVPLLAFYAARGFRLVEETVQQRWPGGPRPGFVELVLAATSVFWLLGIDGRRLYLSLSLGSPHHIVADQNRALAEELGDLLGTDSGPIASWHPAIAVYADRDWRVLPDSDLPGIVRYLEAAGAEALVLSAYYPPDLGVENLNTRYLVLPVPESDGERHDWQLHLVRGDTIRALGRLDQAP